jgi:hypothetical protein
MRVSGAAASRHPVGIFQVNIVSKKGAKSKENSSLFKKINSFHFNNLDGSSSRRDGPSIRSSIKDVRGGRFFSQLAGKKML